MSFSSQLQGRGLELISLGSVGFLTMLFYFVFFLNHILHKISAGGWSKDLLPQKKTAVKDLSPA